MGVKKFIMDILKNIGLVCNLLDEIEDYDSELPSKLSLVDSKISDLLHLIERDKLKSKQAYRVIQELHKLRCERREIKNQMTLMNVFKNEKNKLLNIEYRKFLLNSVEKEEKKLDKSVYSNRVYTEQELSSLIGD